MLKYAGRQSLEAVGDTIIDVVVRDQKNIGESLAWNLATGIAGEEAFKTSGRIFNRIGGKEFVEKWLQKWQRKNPRNGTGSNIDARKWYLEEEAKILDQLDPNLSLRERAVAAFNKRNELRTKARELMVDRDLAEKLMRTEPNMTLRDLVKRKYQQKNLAGDELWQDILDSSVKSRKSVNERLGIE